MILPFINTSITTIPEHLSKHLSHLDENSIFIEPCIGENSLFNFISYKYGVNRIIINHPDNNITHIYNQIKNNIGEVMGDYFELIRIYRNSTIKTREIILNGINGELENPELCPVLKAVYLIYVNTTPLNIILSKEYLKNLYINLQKVNIFNTSPNDVIIDDENCFYYIPVDIKENAAFAANSRDKFLGTINSINQKFLIYDGKRNY